MNTILKSDLEYKQWLIDLKYRIRNSQIKAALKVNTELINLYWDLGKEIVSKQEQSQWGDGLIKQLSSDLQQEFPDIKGFSISNIKYIKQWYLFYYKHVTIGQQLVGQLEISEYELTRLCPEDFKGSLPSIEEIEAELKE